VIPPSGRGRDDGCPPPPAQTPSCHPAQDSTQLELHAHPKSGKLFLRQPLVVLLASVRDDRPRAVLLEQPVATFRSLVESRAYSLQLEWFLYGVLKHFDLPDLAGCLAPRRCWLMNATDSQGVPLPESELGLHYNHALEVYKQSAASGQLRFLVCTHQERREALEAWVRSS